MRRRGFIVGMALTLAALWAGVWWVRRYAESKRETTARVSEKIRSADFEDWSGYEQAPNAAESRRREDSLRDIADMVNRLDFAERQKGREDRTLEGFFRRMDGAEKKEFIELTLKKSMTRMMEALDKMPPEQRRKFVEDGLRDVERGKTAEDMERAQELGGDVLEKVANEGMKAYFEKANTDAKLDLAPLMDSINEAMQGLKEKPVLPGEGP